MTDKEMALALGEYIVNLIGRIHALEGTFLEYRVTNEEGHRVEIPWKEDSKRIALEPAVRDLSDAQLRYMRESIGDETQGSDLIRALYSHFVKI